MKVVINKCYGGFGLSPKAVMRYAELAGMTLYHDSERQFGFDHFYKIPAAEYKDLYEQARKKRDYSQINDLYFSYNLIKRDDPNLVQVVEELGLESWGKFAELNVVTIPDDVEWQIEDYDGWETIAEVRETWGELLQTQQLR